MTERAPASRAWLDRIGRALARPIDAAWLAAFRFTYGVTLAIGLVRFARNDWVELFLVQPRFHFKYWGFEWVEALPGAWMQPFVYGLAALAIAVAVGAFYRIASWAFVLGFSYLELIDVTTYLNHYYLAVWLALLLALSPAHRTASFDAWRRRRRSVPPAAAIPAGVPAFWLYTLRFQVAVVYVFAAVAKAQSDWLLHAQPLGIWLGARSGLEWVGPVFQWPWAAHVMSWLGFGFDLTIALWLSFARTRRWAFVALIGFHVLTGALFPIGMFPVIMVTSALVFFSPSWPRWWLARFARVRDAVPRFEAHAFQTSPRRGALLCATLALYGALHLALPLRHFAYPGSVLWHEQGMRWSWRVMVREKNGSVTFAVRDADSGAQWSVSPRRYLTAVQEREMSGQPDLILQLAHHIRDDFRARGHARVEVRAQAWVSLNARPMRLLIDPAIDLAAVEDGVLPARWITSPPTEPPRRLRPLSG